MFKEILYTLIFVHDWGLAHGKLSLTENLWVVKNNLLKSKNWVKEALEKHLQTNIDSFKSYELLEIENNDADYIYAKDI